MKRNPELAHEISLRDDIANARHFAIDKVTSAHLAVDLLARHANDPIQELETEERAMELMEDAVYFFHKYIRRKLKAYEEAINQRNKEGEALVRKHIDELQTFKEDLSSDKFN